jgi:hypothetical protein
MDCLLKTARRQSSASGTKRGYCNQVCIRSDVTLRATYQLRASGKILQGRDKIIAIISTFASFERILKVAKRTEVSLTSSMIALAVVGCCAVLIPAWRAATTHPMRILRMGE